MGASYGGYAALIGAARDASAFRCAIAWVAPTDLPALLDQWRSELGDTNEVVRELEMTIGRPQDLRQTSPVNRVGEVKVPLLAAWGVTDRRIPIAQGRRFRDAALAAKVDLEYIEYADEGHVWMKPATRIDFFGRAEKLLARTLGVAR
jgi:dipeptidyl aminopeptidase/acylaminoacyl peptidase